MKRIELTQNKYAIVDEEDFEYLSQWKWYVSKTGYAHRNTKRSGGGQKTIRMHRQIVGAEPGEVVDHINHDILDNRRSNLRKCTNRQNQYNSRVRPSNKLGIKGIHIFSNREYPVWSRFHVQIQVNRNKIHLGYFRTIREAVDIYNDASRIYFGEFACITELSKEKEQELNGLLESIIQRYS
jgi:hypothetical protein